MDKNFIKVDDLFRQRLGDGEERERSGAWLNMRELLDREMPQQKRIGAFYWRRLFSAVAALSLIGMVGVSSYELSAAFRNRTVSDVIPEVPVSVNGEPAKVLNMTDSRGEARKEVKTLGRPGAVREETGGRETYGANIAPANNIGGEVSAPTPSANRGNIKETNSNNANTVAVKEGENTAATHPITVDANTHEAYGKTTNSTTAGNNRDAVKPVQARAKNTSDAIASAGAAETNGSENGHTAHNAGGAHKTAANAEGKHNKEVAMNTGRASATGAHTGKGQSPAKANNSTGEGEAANTAAGSNTVSRARDARHADAARKNVAVASGVQPQDGGAVPTGEEARKDRVAATGAGKTHANLPAGSNKPADMALNSTVNAGSDAKKSSKESHVAGNSDALHKLASENINKLAAADIATMGREKERRQNGDQVNIPASAAGGSEGTMAGKDAPVATAPGHEENNNEHSASSPASTSIHDQPSTGKKVITKLVVHERTFKVADNEYALRSDTISKERIELDLSGKSEPAAVASKEKMEEAPATVSSKKARKRFLGRKNGGAAASTPGMAGNASPAQHKSGTHAVGAGAGSASSLLASSASGSPAPGNAANDGEITPASASRASSATSSEITPAASAEEVKAKTSESKHKGMSVIKKLAMAFNDVKNNASKTTFAPGLTAGVNSYFFGPSTLKGFQFGLTGDIIFNDKWNVMTELKYFHRVNGNTSIQDNYYSYTPVGSQYLKQLQLNSYSFSALHSLEVPVSVRYHMGNFNFYAGGNMLYAFSINTGASAIPAYNVAPEYVNTPGADDKGVLSEKDFASRFGLGYLFGFSYNVSQNFSLDLRNVQTVWDNAATTGAKSISSQLYKTPSIQLSVMYRLGGNRSKD